eukprot:3538105-Amphidinium_carterae.1
MQWWYVPVIPTGCSNLWYALNGSNILHNCVLMVHSDKYSGGHGALGDDGTVCWGKTPVTDVHYVDAEWFARRCGAESRAGSVKLHWRLNWLCSFLRLPNKNMVAHVLHAYISAAKCLHLAF